MAKREECQTLRIGEIARRFGVSPDTLRHYERVGVLPPASRSAAGYREYPLSVLARLRVIRSALAAGFTLAELARAFRIRARGGAPCREVRRLAAEKLAEVEQTLAALAAQRDILRRLVADWDHRLAETPPDTAAGLLEMISLLPGGEDEELVTPAAFSHRMFGRCARAPRRIPSRGTVDRLDA